MRTELCVRLRSWACSPCVRASLWIPPYQPRHDERSDQECGQHREIGGGGDVEDVERFDKEKVETRYGDDGEQRRRNEAVHQRQQNDDDQIDEGCGRGIQPELKAYPGGACQGDGAGEPERDQIAEATDEGSLHVRKMMLGCRNLLAIDDSVDSYEISRAFACPRRLQPCWGRDAVRPGTNEAARGRRRLGIGPLRGSVVDSASALDLGGVPCQFRQYEQSSCD